LLALDVDPATGLAALGSGVLGDFDCRVNCDAALRLHFHLTCAAGGGDVNGLVDCYVIAGGVGGIDLYDLVISFVVVVRKVIVIICRC